MKVLLQDSFNRNKSCFEIVEARVSDTVYVEVSTDDYVPYEYPAVLHLITTFNKDIYIVLSDVAEAEAVLQRLFEGDSNDLTYYCESTFVEPSWCDVPTLERLLRDVTV